LENIPTSSESEKIDIGDAFSRNSSYYIDKLDSEVTMLPALKQLPPDFLTLGEEQAAITFNNLLGKFEYNAKQKGVGNALEITRPDGTTFDIELMSGKAYLFAQNTDDFKQRLAIKHNQFVLDAAAGKSNLVVTMSNDFMSNPDYIDESIKGYTSALNIPDEEDQKFLAQATTGSDDNSMYTVGGVFDEDLFMTNLMVVKNKLKPIYDKAKEEYSQRDEFSMNLGSIEASLEERNKNKKISETYSRLDSILKKHEAQKRRTSRLIGAALKYSDFNIDLNNQETLDNLTSEGVNPMDIPLPSLKLNGEKASFQDIYDVISKPVELRYVRSGEINIEIDETIDSGILNDYVKKIAEVRDRNFAFLEENPGTNQFFRGVGDFFEGLYVHSLDIMNDFGHAFSDGLQAIGVPKPISDFIVFEKQGVVVGAGNGGFGLSSLPFLGLPSTERIDDLKKLLPEYDMTISDSRDAGEFLAMGMDGFTKSIPYTAAFIANPALGYTVTAVGGYGSNREEMNIAIQSAKDAKASGAILTEREQALLDMSNTEARVNALSKAGIETALTAAFTGKYFRQIALSNNLKNIPKTKESAQQFADAFARKNRTGLIAGLEKFTGLEASVLSKEVPEETLISTFTYMTDVVWGLEEYDQKKMNKLIIDSGLNSIFSSIPMGAAGRAITPNINKRADDYIKRKINIEGEVEASVEKLKVDGAIDDLLKKGVDTNSREMNVALDLRDKLNQKIDDIDKRKQDLVNQMTVSDKKKFLQGISNLEGFQQVILNGEDPVVVDNSISLINEEKQKISNILSKYPSELSYHFLPDSEQKSLRDRAMKEIEQEKIAEAEERGGNYTIDINEMDSEVIKRASEIYVKDVKEAKSDVKESISVNGYFFDVPSEYYTETTDEQASEFDINTAISKVESELFNEDNLDLFSQTTQETTQETTEQVDQQATQDVTEDVAQEAITEETKSPEQNNEIERRNNVIQRIKELNKSNRFYNNLGSLEQKIIVDFFKDLEKGKTPKFGRVENVVRSQEIAYKLLTLNNGGINVFQDSERVSKIKKWYDVTNPLWYLKNKINPFSMINEVYPYLNNQGRKMMTATGKGRVVFTSNQMTADVLLGAIFRNTEKGKPMIDLVDSGNRNVAISMNQAQDFYTEDLAQWKKDVIEFNKTVPLAKRIPLGLISDLEGTQTGLYDTQLSVDYEMQVLAHLKRTSGKKDNITGMDTEFMRQKNSLLKELELRKEEFENNKNDLVLKTKYNQLKDVLENLGVLKDGIVADVKSFDDIKNNARTPILKALDRLSSRFPHQEAKKRKMDYDGAEMFFQEGSYVPSFRVTSDGSNVTDGRDGNPSKYGTMAGLLEDVTEDDQLENSRISFGNYLNRAYGQLRGVLIDMNARSDFETLNSMVGSQQFKSLFPNEQEYEMVKKYFGSRLDVFNGLVTEGQNANVDFGDLPNTFFSGNSKFMQTAYSTLSSLGLSRINQPASQFYSALSGTYPLLTDARAKNHAINSGFRFVVGLSEAGNGQKTEGGAFKQKIAKLVNGGNLSNIYDKSRTGLRNALKAEFAIDNQKSLPLSYYISRFGLKEDFGKQVFKGSKYTIDSFLDVINKSNELSLEFFLANADRAAANTSFEAHYLQHRIDQGARVPDTNLKDWWVKENENPNIEAIQYADRKVAETMRQTEPTSEAEFYSKDASGLTKASQRTLFAWGKFQMNAKANFANQYARTLDPNVPEVEKEEARRRMRGIMSEVLTFQGIKNVSNSAIMTGLAGAYLSLMGGDEDDIRRYGGMNKLINDILLPIESRDYKELLDKLPRSESQTLEKFKLSMTESASGIDQTLLDLYKVSYEFEKKNTLGPDANVIIKATSDAMRTVQPFAVADPLVDISFIALNELFGEEITPDYMSKDLEKASKDTDGLFLALKENAGMLSLAAESVDKLIIARRLYKEKVFTKGVRTTGSGEIVEYVGAENEVMEQKLDKAIKALYWGRLINLTSPGPKGDFNKILNKLERQIETKFTKSAPTLKGSESAFIKFYMEKMSEKGEKIDPNNFSEWWSKEKKNMNPEARRYATEKIEEMKRKRVYNQE
jgi:hypothetical protein